MFQDKLGIYNHFYSNRRGDMKGKKKRRIQNDKTHNENNKRAEENNEKDVQNQNKNPVLHVNISINQKQSNINNFLFS